MTIAEHEAAHTAAALLLGVPVESARLTDRGGGITTLGPSSAEARIKAIAAAHEGAWPPGYPQANGTDDDTDRLAAITKAASITGPEWDALMHDTRALTDTPAFKPLSGAVALLLRKHNEVIGEQLQRLLTATKSKGEDMAEYDEERVGERDELGVLTDDALDHALARSRAIRAAEQREHVNGDRDPVEQKAYDTIIALNQAA